MNKFCLVEHRRGNIFLDMFSYNSFIYLLMYLITYHCTHHVISMIVNLIDTIEFRCKKLNK